LLSKSKGIDIVIPVFNEIYISELLGLFENDIRTPFRVLLCYDFDSDKTLTSFRSKDYNFEIHKVKNKYRGPHGAIMSGIEDCIAEAVIVYPADDFINTKIIDYMYELFLQGNDLVVPSRFIKGGKMKNCPLIKSILVRVASFTLFYLSSVPVKDISNGFRLFSLKYLHLIKIESKRGFTFSIELLVKADRLGLSIKEIPSCWEEREFGRSRFKISAWILDYLKWYFYGLATFWLRKSPNTVKLKN
tara:strand:+ start:2189 stop:2926 length:738 start_codon:yes stop_codon:yes gene_type:complete